MSTPAIRVLIADDHPVVRAGLASVVTSEGDVKVVAEAADGAQAMAEFRRHRPDVSILDLRMPGTGGLEAIAGIRGEQPDARVLVLTTYDGDEEIYEALRAGARGYLLKSASAAELLGAVRTVHAGGRCVPAEIAARLAERLPAASLTPREREVMALVAAGRTNAEIAASLHLTAGTVKGYVHTIFEKLGVTHRAEAVAAAIRRGLVRPG